MPKSRTFKPEALKESEIQIYSENTKKHVEQLLSTFSQHTRRSSFVQNTDLNENESEEQDIDVKVSLTNYLIFSPMYSKQLECTICNPNPNELCFNSQEYLTKPSKYSLETYSAFH